LTKTSILAILSDSCDVHLRKARNMFKTLSFVIAIVSLAACSGGLGEDHYYAPEDYDPPAKEKSKIDSSSGGEAGSGGEAAGGSTSISVELDAAGSAGVPLTK
jgi:hypothetical protein